MQQKLLLCIDDIMEGKGKHQNDQIWVWGKNDFGQLGVSHANYVHLQFNLDSSPSQTQNGLPSTKRSRRLHLLWVVSNFYQNAQG